MSRLFWVPALLSALVGCSQTLVVGPSGEDPTDPGTPSLDLGAPDTGRPDPDDDMGADDMRPDDMGPDDMGPDPGPPSFCPRARPAVPAACGGSLTEPPCLLAQMAAEPELRCLYHALDVVLACAPGARTQFAGLDLLAPRRTIFAPTNAAMEARLSALDLDLDGLQRLVAEDASCRGATDAQREALTALFGDLAYHIADGRFSAERLRAERSTPLRSVVGQLELGPGIVLPVEAPGALSVRYVDEELVAQRARVTRSDIAVTVGRGDPNTVLHAIDTFLPTPSVLDVAVLEGLDAFVAAVQRAAPVAEASGARVPFADLLRSPELDLTVFVPSQDAFDALGALPGRNALRDVLLFHASDNDGPRNSGDAFLLFSIPDTLRTLAGTDLQIDGAARPPTVEGGSRTRLGADMVRTDLQGANGVVHVIDRVLTPP